MNIIVLNYKFNKKIEEKKFVQHLKNRYII